MPSSTSQGLAGGGGRTSPDRGIAFARSRVRSCGRVRGRARPRFGAGPSVRSPPVRLSVSRVFGNDKLRPVIIILRLTSARACAGGRGAAAGAGRGPAAPHTVNVPF